MNNDILSFGAKIAWPLVALVGIFILGPGGILQKIIGQLADNLFRITDSVAQFKETAADFTKTQSQLRESADWVRDLRNQLDIISGKLESIATVTEQLAITEATKTIEGSVVDDNSSSIVVASDGRSAEEMYADIRYNWDQLVEKLKGRIDPSEFDARSIGQMARKLSDRRRSNPLAAADAELIERLHSQLKRFNRLKSSKGDWLTHEIYTAFIRGVAQADRAISAKAGKLPNS